MVKHHFFKGMNTGGAGSRCKRGNIPGEAASVFPLKRYIYRE